jgi:hypothetical protein
MILHLFLIFLALMVFLSAAFVCVIALVYAWGVWSSYLWWRGSGWRP